MVFPPRPGNISIPAVVAGNVLQSDDTSVSVVEDGYDGSIIMKTDNQLAMVITPDQHISVNTQSIESQFTINNNSTTKPTIRLSYADSYYFDGGITVTGNMLFTPSCDDPILNPTLFTAFTKNLDILDHDGMTKGLHLGGRLVRVTATELNYLDVPTGAAQAGRAMILDNSKDIAGINNLGATSISGVLQTGSQPNITSLGTVNVTEALTIRGQTVDIAPVRYLRITTEGIAYASKAVILDQDKNIFGINALSASAITGILTSGPQPNITSLSALTSLINNGPTSLNGILTVKSAAGAQIVVAYSSTIVSMIGTNAVGDMVLSATSRSVRIAPSCDLRVPGHDGATAGLILGEELVTATAAQLNAVDAPFGTASASKALLLDAAKSVVGINNISAATIFGVIQTPSQPLIASVATLNITNHATGTGLALGGTLVTATATQLNYTAATPGVAAPNKALILDSNSRISGIGSLTASTLTGVLQTASQPNLTQVNTLTILAHNGITGLVLGSTLVTTTGVELNRVSTPVGVAAGGKVMILDGSKNIVGINYLSSNNLSGILQTSIQPNIAQVNALDISMHDGGTVGLRLNDVLITATADQLNRITTTPGTATNLMAMVVDSARSISNINVLRANTLGGILLDGTQLNIRNLASINVTDHNGSTAGLKLNGVLVISAAYQLNYVSVQQGVASPSKALVLDSSGSIENINQLTATNITGVLLTATQPYLTRVGTLNITNHNGSTTGLSLGGVLVAVTAAQINALGGTPGSATPNRAMITNSANNISGIGTLSAAFLNGTLLTANQPNVTAVDVLNITRHAGTTGLSLAGVLVTASADQLNRLDTPVGTARAGGALVVDAQLNLSGINTLTTVNVVGKVTTRYQPDIEAVDSLDIEDHNGSTIGLSLGGVLVSSTAAQLNFNAVTPGAAQPVHSLVTDANNSINGINAIVAQSVTAGRLALSGVISNFNTGGVVVKSYSMTNLVGRMVDIRLMSALSFTNFQPALMANGFSSEIIGYIKPLFSESHTFYITCNDRVRLWVNGAMLLNSWVRVTGARTSSSVFLNASQWVPIYIQYQADVGSIPTFLLEWTSTSTDRGPIGATNLAWDNNPPSSASNFATQNSMTIFNTSTASSTTAKMSVGTSGELVIDSSGNNVILGAADSFNIPAHNGTTGGLYLGGALVLPTAYEINYLKVSPGQTSPSHALVVDASNSISGINSLTATSVACTNLTTSAFSINNLSLSGPLNNYNTGALLVRQITGANVGGRVVNVDTTKNLNLQQYDPRGLGTNYSLDISGYILPAYTESYTFHAVANDRVRIWVGSTLILNVWSESTGLEYASAQVSLTAGVWVPIYIQFQETTNTQLLQVMWSSTSVAKSFIPSASMAWDNTIASPARGVRSPDAVVVFSAASGVNTVQTASMAVDASGNMTLAANSGLIRTATGIDLDVMAHNGSTAGLRLGGVLVRATAPELNYLSGVTPGTIYASKALILDANSSISGITTLSCTNIAGTITTPTQPNITSLGTITSTLACAADLIIGRAGIASFMRLATESSACYLQAGATTATNSAADLLIGNYNVDAAASSRKLMIKASGFVGIQTSAPTRALSINDQGAAYCLRLVNNAADGSEDVYCDIGVTSTSALRIASNITLGATGSAVLSVDSNGVMQIVPSGGSVQIGNATDSSMPLEVGSTTFTLSSSSQAGYLNSSGSVGAAVIDGTQYSMRTASSIIVNGTVCVTSDRRLKSRINELSPTVCRDFILGCRPVSFVYRSEPSATHCGLIAQEVGKSEFGYLVRTAPYENLAREVDEDGYASPANAAFNVAYEEIIPILMTTTKETLLENAHLKLRVEQLETQMRTIMDKLNMIG